MSETKQYSWIGDDCPPSYEWRTSIDIADPANITWALDKGFKIGATYDGHSGSVAEPCYADCYAKVLDVAKS